MGKLLVVDDETALRDTLSYAFGREGFEVTTAATGNQALAIARDEVLEMVVLDLVLPDRDGAEVCQQIRKASRVPIVMLTARDQAEDRLRGFEVGADDYVTKPFNTRELVARVHAVLRREQSARALLAADQALLEQLGEIVGKREVPPGPTGSSAGAAMKVGDLAVLAGRSAVVLGDRTLELTAAEYKLLKALCLERGRVVTRTDLVTWIWGESSNESRALLEAVVRTLRQKVEVDAACPERITTVPGIGYQLNVRNGGGSPEPGTR